METKVRNFMQWCNRQSNFGQVYSSLTPAAIDHVTSLSKVFKQSLTLVTKIIFIQAVYKREVSTLETHGLTNVEIFANGKYGLSQ